MVLGTHELLGGLSHINAASQSQENTTCILWVSKVDVGSCYTRFMQLLEAHAVTVGHADSADDRADDANKSLICSAQEQVR